jgi:mannosyltransferase OCH1-like enzyme
VIPRIVHQVWLGADQPTPPPHMAAASRSWATRNPGWEHRVWTAAEVEELFARARPDLLAFYRGYPRWIQRSDAARYLILHEHGGVYADMDIACVRTLEPLAGEELVLAPTWPFGLSNDLMMTRPGHPFFRAVLDGLPGAFHRWNRFWVPPFVRVLSGGGSSYLTSVWHRMSADAPARLLTPEEYGQTDTSRAFVRHLPGSTWHDWDAHLALWVWHHRRGILSGAALVVAGAAILALL